MNPVKFHYANATFAKDQPAYQPLPAYTDGNRVISCWSLNWRERLYVLLHGLVWFRVMTFGRPLQSQRAQVYSPFPKMQIVSETQTKGK